MLPITLGHRLMPRTDNLRYHEVRRYLFWIEVGGKLVPPLDTGPYHVVARFDTGSVHVINSFRCVVGDLSQGVLVRRPRALNAPMHSSGCSDQNVLSPTGMYYGAAECGCNRG